MLTISQSMGGQDELMRNLSAQTASGIRVCLPCVVNTVDYDKQTVDAQPLIREQTRDEQGKTSFINYPLLINVPIVFPCAGDYAITLPVAKGDECLVVFSDVSYDNWWISGGVQNPIENRRHDLSDGFAIFGIKNQNKRLANYSPDTMQLINTKTGRGLEVNAEGIKITGKLMANGVDLASHVHQGEHGITGRPMG